MLFLYKRPVSTKMFVNKSNNLRFDYVTMAYLILYTIMTIMKYKFQLRLKKCQSIVRWVNRSIRMYIAVGIAHTQSATVKLCSKEI